MEFHARARTKDSGSAAHPANTVVKHYKKKREGKNSKDESTVQMQEGKGS